LIGLNNAFIENPRQDKKYGNKNGKFNEMMDYVSYEKGQAVPF
jgi:hypothetical protein